VELLDGVVAVPEGDPLGVEVAAADGDAAELAASDPATAEVAGPPAAGVLSEGAAVEEPAAGASSEVEDPDAPAGSPFDGEAAEAASADDPLATPVRAGFGRDEAAGLGDSVSRTTGPLSTAGVAV
jgi:hypothetical protein